MLGLSRLAYSLSTNRQIPSALGRLHPTRSTPWVLIVLATVIAAGLAIPRDLDMLLGLYAFGALLGADRSPTRRSCGCASPSPTARARTACPGTSASAAHELPSPAVLGIVLSVAAWVSVVVTHTSARVGGPRLDGRSACCSTSSTAGPTGKSLLRRVTVPREALLGDHHGAEYGSILVPIFGSTLDDDIIQTAGRLAAEEGYDTGEGPTIEAIWVFEVPMSLPIDARLPGRRARRARARRSRAPRRSGRSTRTSRSRPRPSARAGPGRRSSTRRAAAASQAIVLAAEEPSKIRGGARLGGLGGPRELRRRGDEVRDREGAVPVILTAPPADDRAVSAGAAAPDASGAGQEGPRGR